MKAIYTLINDKYFKINQGTRLPTKLLTNLPEQLSLKENPASICLGRQCQGSITANLSFTDFTKTATKTNKDLYSDLFNTITTEQISQIDELRNSYMVSIDFSVYDENGSEKEHSVIIKPLEVADYIYPLGVTEDNECVYRRIKKVNINPDILIDNTVTFGIQNRSNNISSTIDINDISIYQARSFNNNEDENTDVHNSMYCQKYDYNSCTISTALENCILVYSTKKEGKILNPINVTTRPVKVTLNVEVYLASMIVIYEEDVIKNIIIENIKKKYHDDNPSTDDEPDDNDCDCCKTYYVICKSNDDDALEVVEDLYPDDIFNQYTMIKKSDIIKYIPEIEIGQYVKLVHAI